jgi:hypothetical protein
MLLPELSARYTDRNRSAQVRTRPTAGALGQMAGISVQNAFENRVKAGQRLYVNPKGTCCCGGCLCVLVLALVIVAFSHPARLST